MANAPAREIATRLGPESLIGQPVILVVATPQGDTRMVAQTYDCASRLTLSLLQISRLKVGIERAGIHEILPDKNAHFIAETVEFFLLENTAAPYAQHVHVRFGSQFQ